MLSNYLPVLILLLLGGLVGAVFTIGNALIGPKSPNEAKLDPYECGLPSEVKDGFRFGVSFYLIAMLFILFDVEVLFLYPIAVQLKAFGVFALIETLVFVALLFVGFIFAWRRGALDWKV